MAFSGLHVISAYAGAGYMRDRSQTVLGKIQWSESPATGVTSTNVAPGFDGQRGQPIFRIRAAADSWVSIGAAPNATSGTRFLVPTGVDYDVYVAPGDKLQWIAA